MEWFHRGTEDGSVVLWAQGDFYNWCEIQTFSLSTVKHELFSELTRSLGDESVLLFRRSVYVFVCTVKCFPILATFRGVLAQDTDPNLVLVQFVQRLCRRLLFIVCEINPAVFTTLWAVDLVRCLCRCLISHWNIKVRSSSFYCVNLQLLVLFASRHCCSCIWLVSADALAFFPSSMKPHSLVYLFRHFPSTGSHVGIRQAPEWDGESCGVT